MTRRQPWYPHSSYQYSGNHQVDNSKIADDDDGQKDEKRPLSHGVLSVIKDTTPTFHSAHSEERQ
jgi:hypothetical protein